MPPMPKALPPPAIPPATGIFPNASLYVGDLDPSVGEAELYDLFNQVAQVISIRVCRDQMKQSSLGYAYVNYSSHHDAASALDVLNFTPLNGKPIRIMFSHRDPSIRKSGYANVFIKNLDASIDNKALRDTFAAFGPVLSCKIAIDSAGQSRGYGFVQFEREDSARDAIGKLNGMLLNDKQVYVGSFVRRQERNRLHGVPRFTNVYVKNFSENTGEEDLREVFGKYGVITSVAVMRDVRGNSRGFGFVNFEKAEDAAAAVDALNGTVFNDEKVLFVGRAQRKSEREAELKARFTRERNNRFEKLQGANLYLKNLDEDIDDDQLKELFSMFGTITSSKVVVDDNGRSRGSGFVAFSAPEEASRAMMEMNGKIIGRKPLYVAVAQRKEERAARLQAHFSQMQAVQAAPLPSGVAAFHPATSRVAPQQIYYGQSNPNMLPPQHTGYAYQQQLMPAIRHNIVPNYMMPYHVQRQAHLQAPQISSRRGNAQHQGFRYVRSPRNGVEPGFVPQAAMMAMTYEVGMPVAAMGNQRSVRVPVSMLTSALASASPERRHAMLGEQLYPLVENLEAAYAGKVTGMLLEMDQNEVLHLIESPDALKKKVREAMDVLHGSGFDIVNGMGSLSMNG